MLHKIPRSNKSGSLAALFILYIYWAPYLAMGSFVLYANVAGTTKKIAAYGISYIGYSTGEDTASTRSFVCFKADWAGNLIAPQLFLAREAPTYRTAIIGMLVFYCLALLLVVIYGYTCWHDNKKKEIQQAKWELEHESHEDGFVAEEWQDLTDKENPHFRYTW